MAVEYNHDLKAADKHISASIELEKAARKDLRPKLRVTPTSIYRQPYPAHSGLAQYAKPTDVRRQGHEIWCLTYPITAGLYRRASAGNIRMAKHQHSLAAHQAEYFVPPCATKPICNTGIP